jgi:hypothetical protein
MPATSPSNEPPPSIAVGDPTADGRSPNPTTPGGQPASDPNPSPADEGLSPAQQLTAERTERRRQRAAAHGAPTRRARRLTGHTESTNARTPPTAMTLRDALSVTLIAVLAAGGVLGAVLGALSAPGWVIGLLVAGLTIVLSGLLARYSPST